MYHWAKPAASDRRQPQNSKRNSLTYNGTAIGGAPNRTTSESSESTIKIMPITGTARHDAMCCPRCAHSLPTISVRRHESRPRFRGRGRAADSLLQPACCSASHAFNTARSMNPSARTAKHTRQSPLQTMAVALLPASSHTDRMPAFTRIETLSSTGWLRNHFVKLP